MPKITIIIPCFNQGIYLKEALNSVRLQTFKDFELIVIDDGSTDMLTQNIIDQNESFIDFIISKQNEGVCKSRNLGAAKASGEYLLFLDSDNVLLPEYLDMTVAMFSFKIGVVYTDYEVFGLNNRLMTQNTYSKSRLRKFNYSLIKADAFNSTKGFDLDLERLGLEDWDMWLQIMSNGWKFAYLPEILFKYRTHKNSRTKAVAMKKETEAISYIYKKHHIQE